TSAHQDAMRWLRWCDDHPAVQPALKNMHRLSFARSPVKVGRVDLPFPAILAAGFVKGTGFATEDEALQAVESGENIIPGWRTMPNLVGAVEFGSFTRYPRLGNPGTVIWREVGTKSTQNRVGLRN